MYDTTLILVALSLLSRVSGQTYSSCNPLYAAGCTPNTALGKAINVDFTQGPVDSFVPSGKPTYDSEGVHFTVARSGEAPQLNSIFYMMFGKVSITMKTAPGAGIVSSLVLQSDTLDEIDMEWLGASDSDMQTNYFGKGDTSTYNRGAFSPIANHQQTFVTYDIEWTASEITWSINNKVVRVLTPETADTNQYPQTPMQVKFGAWSAGDPANDPGTIQWARGPTDYTKGPFTMTVKSIAVTDYSTGTQYKYGDHSGNWGSIIAIGGKVNSNTIGQSSRVRTAEVPSVTSPSPSIPAGLGKDHGSTSTMTMWPWVATTSQPDGSKIATANSGLPSGWVITDSGKVVPANDAVMPPAPSLSLSSASSPASQDDVRTKSEETSNNNVESQNNSIPSGAPDTNTIPCSGSQCNDDKQSDDTGVSSTIKVSVDKIRIYFIVSGLGAYFLGSLYW